MHFPTRRTVSALIACLGLAAASRSAGAEFPPSNTIVPPCIPLVGTSGNVPDHGAGSFQVIVRDLANNPVVGARVYVDLSGCPDLHMCADQLDPTLNVDCANMVVSKLSGAAGIAEFTLLGGSNGSGNAVELLGAGKVFVNGVLLGFPTVSAFDLDGRNGVGINDLSVWLTDFGTVGNPPFGRSDFDCSGSVGVNDLSLWLTAFGSGAQVQSCGGTCP